MGELIEFRIGCGLEVDSLLGQLGHLMVALGMQFGVLDGAHGECSGHEPGEPGEYEQARVDARAGESLADPGRGQNSVAGFGYMRARPLGDLSRGADAH